MHELKKKNLPPLVDWLCDKYSYAEVEATALEVWRKEYMKNARKEDLDEQSSFIRNGF